MSHLLWLVIYIFEGGLSEPMVTYLVVGTAIDVVYTEPDGGGATTIDVVVPLIGLVAGVDNEVLRVVETPVDGATEGAVVVPAVVVFIYVVSQRRRNKIAASGKRDGSL